MIDYKFGGLTVRIDTYGYFYLGNITTHISLSENYFRFFNFTKTSFFRLQIFTEPTEVIYDFHLSKVLLVSFFKSFNVGKFYFNFVSNV